MQDRGTSGNTGTTEKKKFCDFFEIERYINGKNKMINNKMCYFFYQ